MPLYEYECKKCGAHFEKIRKFSDPPLVKCEKCGGKLEQLISPPAVQFKGSGWYVTDYARKPSTGDKTEVSASSKDGSKDGSKDSGSDAKKSSEAKKSTEPASVGTK